MRENKWISIAIGLVIFIVVAFRGNSVVYNFLAILLYGLFMGRTFYVKRRVMFNSKAVTSLVIGSITLVLFQYAFFAYYSQNYTIENFIYFLTHWFGISMLIFTVGLERIFLFREASEVYWPDITDKKTFRLFDIHKASHKIASLKDSVSYETINEIVTDLPRHRAFSYVNGSSLTMSYFDAAMKTLDDPYVYIVISNTGSAASDLISVFTQKSYNHASLSFDRELDTVISYNGGEKVFPPGLNQEMVEYFNKKEDASIMVYRLETSREQKLKLINKVKEINEEGSAYNLIGLVIKYRYLPNIMFCSQFVYSMLKHAGLDYFHKKEDLVKPTDLVELDYYRKLEFCYDIRFDTNPTSNEINEKTS